MTHEEVEALRQRVDEWLARIATINELRESDVPDTYGYQDDGTPNEPAEETRWVGVTDQAVQDAPLYAENMKLVRAAAEDVK